VDFSFPSDMLSFFLVAAATAAPASVHTNSAIVPAEVATGTVPGSLSWGIENGMANRNNTVLTDSMLAAGKAQIGLVEMALPALQDMIGLSVERRVVLDLVRAIGAVHRLQYDDLIKQLQANISGTEYEPVADLIAAVPDSLGILDEYYTSLSEYMGPVTQYGGDFEMIARYSALHYVDCENLFRVALGEPPLVYDPQAIEILWVDRVKDYMNQYQAASGELGCAYDFGVALWAVHTAQLNAQFEQLKITLPFGSVAP